MSIRISETEINGFQERLKLAEKSEHTIEKYVRDVKKFQAFLGERKLSKDEVRDFKDELISKYKVGSVNSILVAVNLFLEMIGLREYRVKRVKEQRRMFYPKEREMSKQEYVRLLEVAWARLCHN